MKSLSIIKEAKSENKQSPVELRELTEKNSSDKVEPEDNIEASIKTIVRVLMEIEKQYQRNIEAAFKEAA